MKKPLRFQRKRKRVSFVRRRAFWLATGALFFAAFVFYAAMFSPWFEIQEVVVQGANEIEPERIVAAVESGFWQGFLGIPQNSILAVRTAKSKEELQKKFPLIDSVIVQRSFPKTLVVNITERKRVGTWCKEDLCFAIDKKGISFKKVEESKEWAVFHSSAAALLGKELIAVSLLAPLLEFQQAFQEAGEVARFSIALFEIQDTGRVEVTTKEGWRILLDAKESMEWQQTKLKLVLQEKIPLEKRGKLDYIDLRFGDQAYVKYHD